VDIDKPPKEYYKNGRVILREPQQDTTCEAFLPASQIKATKSTKMD
jgi:hypothetical protein